MRTYSVTGGGGIRLHVEETGTPEGQPILFIHGFSQSRLAWSKQLESDLGDEFRLVALDIRGHGLSEKPRDAYGDARLWADDLKAVIDTLGLAQPILCGWSYGGVIIGDYLRAYGEEAIGAVHLVGAATKLGGEDALALIGGGFLTLVPGFVSTDAEESIEALATFLRLCVHDEPPAQDFYRMLGYNAIVPPHVRQGLLSRALTNDDLLPRLRRPVLITHGDEDAIVLPAASDHHARLVPHARVLRYPNVGHAPFWEAAPRFNADLRAFARSLRDTPAATHRA